MRASAVTSSRHSSVSPPQQAVFRTKPCVTQFTSGSSIAGCNNLNTNCICSNKDFLSNIACCLIDKCDEAGRDAAIAYAKSICATADPPVEVPSEGPPVEVPSEVVCNSSSSSSKGTAATTGASTTGGSTTGGTTQAPTTGTTSTPTSAAQTSSSSGAAMVNMGSSGMGLAGGFAAALVLL
ncbi:hypothetical protein VE04_06035 [Pseudogymnoascus sp. 24MN13]|nr:hypothetical protein VE04_06035 [Pseudogymnoascus sp. 24MN13]